ncbi:plant invertase/pectin methylesterase inhibitor [Striga asiatica]|uniref:pectinesterase n=1 Tax=Striga asiatica TaxID=4170 RepID=A0A5A7R854_STRAF|nr:plant invertase/pectin methylesterase inhibitor [Striga asiatica]
MSRFRDILAGKLNSGDNPATRKKKLILAALSSVLLLAAVVGTVAGVRSNRKNPDRPESIKTSHALASAKYHCTTTRYPDLCFSTLSDSINDGRRNLTSHKDFILVTLEKTISAAEKNILNVEKLLNDTRRKFTERERQALNDCLQETGLTLDELRSTVAELKEYPSVSKSIASHADDLKTLLSAALTNQDTCREGFSYTEKEKHDREVFVDGEVLHVEKLCSNSLAMLTNMTNADVAAAAAAGTGGGRRLLEAGGWPDRNVKDGSTTFKSATVAAVGAGFLARDITFQNTAGPAKHQAVALRVGSDLSAFYRCDMLGYQDTLYVHSNRQFFTSCLVIGTVDFIFGNGAAVFQNCTILARLPDPNQRNMVTAQGRIDPNQNTGIVIQNCHIGATPDLFPVRSDFPTYLGRPWKEYSRTVIMQSTIDDVIRPTGWHEWNGEFALDTLVYLEYRNTGPGANTTSRVTWRGFKVVTSADEVRPYTAENFIDGRTMDTVQSFKGYGKVDEIEESNFRRKTRRRLIILSVSLVLLAALIAAVVTGVVIHNRKSGRSGGIPTTPAAAIRTVCGVTQYPEACAASLSGANSSDPAKIFRFSLTVAADALRRASTLPGAYAANSSDPLVKAAASVCGAVLDDAVDFLNDAAAAAVSDGGGLFSSETVGDMRTWLSSVVTDQETCLDALEEAGAAFAGEVRNRSMDAAEFASNSLAIVSKFLSLLGEFKIPFGGHRRLLAAEEDFPAWVAEEDRRMLAAAKPPRPNVTVARDGSGDVRTVKEAVERIPKKSKFRFVIYVKAGKYTENVVIDKHHWYVTMYGDGKEATIISGSKNFIDGTPTFSTATFAVTGKGFIARDMKFENTAGAAKHQAVALRSGSDLSIFHRCSFDAFQDTLYAHSNRQFYRDCDITGTIDFVFGNAAVVFQSCRIMPRQPLANQFVTITAQGKKDPNQNTGISIDKCVLTPLDKLTAQTYLGRPWKDFSTTVIMRSSIGSFLSPLGWISWVPNVDPPNTIFYAESQNTGPGAGTDKRVKWAGYKPSLPKAQAARFDVESFIQASTFLPAANVAYERN